MFQLNFNSLYEKLNELTTKLGESESNNFPIVGILFEEIKKLKENSEVYGLPHHVEDYCSEIISSTDNTFLPINNRIIVFEREYYTTDNKLLYYRFTEPNILMVLNKKSLAFKKISDYYDIDEKVETLILYIRQTEDGKWHLPLNFVSVEVDSNYQFKNLVMAKDETSMMKTSMPSDSYQSLIKNGIQENAHVIKNIFIASYSIGIDWVHHPYNEQSLWIPDYTMKSAKNLTADESNKRKAKDQKVKIELDKFNRYDFKI